MNYNSYFAVCIQHASANLQQTFERALLRTWKVRLFFLRVVDFIHNLIYSQMREVRKRWNTWCRRWKGDMISCFLISWKNIFLSDKRQRDGKLSMRVNQVFLLPKQKACQRKISIKVQMYRLKFCVVLFGRSDKLAYLCGIKTMLTCKKTVRYEKKQY